MLYVNIKTGVEVLTDCEILGEDWELKTPKKKNNKKKAPVQPSDEEVTPKPPADISIQPSDEEGEADE